jgi:hypothetical protein
VTRVKTSIYIDDRLRRAAKKVAIRSGLKEYEVHEEALRMYLGWDRLEALLDRHTNFTEEEAMRIATEEVHQVRSERAGRRVRHLS